MQDKELTHEESIHVIQGMIGLARNKINDTGFHFMLWGILVMLASLIQYFMLNNGYTKESNWIWVIMTVIGVPIGIVYEYRRGKKGRTQTKFDKIYGSLWLGFGITLIVSVFVSLSYGINPIASILSLIGLATFVSGAIYRFVPLIIGAIVFWSAAVISPQISFENQLLVYAFVIFLGYIVPGILLWQKSKAGKDV
jgi:membrane-associated HD superfamily phosphohydrolase